MKSREKILHRPPKKREKQFLYMKKISFICLTFQSTVQNDQFGRGEIIKLTRKILYQHTEEGLITTIFTLPLIARRDKRMKGKTDLNHGIAPLRFLIFILLSETWEAIRLKESSERHSPPSGKELRSNFAKSNAAAYLEVVKTSKNIALLKKKKKKNQTYHGFIWKGLMMKFAF